MPLARDRQPPRPPPPGPPHDNRAGSENIELARNEAAQSDLFTMGSRSRTASRKTSGMTIPHIRNLTTADLSTVCEIQAACYGPSWLEPMEAFARKLEAAPGWSWMAWVNGAPAGYLIGLPVENIESPRLPALGSTEPIAAVNDATGFYLHDLAIAPHHRGTGVAPALFAAALQHAQSMQLQCMALVAVQDSVPYWQRFGFAPTPADTPALKAKLLTFGTHAEFMMRSVQE